ncbi:MAG: gp58-like family protein [Bacteroides sp.]|nr:gp58-like family protein [Bacteroides sp.]
MLAPYDRINAAGVVEKKYKLEIDDLTVRGNLRVFEFIISQLRGENDNVIFAGQMKVVAIDTGTNTIYLDTEEGIVYNSFREGDILMVQQYQGMPTPENDYYITKQYELVVTEAGVGNLADEQNRVDYIRFKNFVGDLSQVKAGDVLTRVDSLTNSTRKGIMKITTIDEFGAPYQDVIYGLKTDPENATKVRMGNLGGLVTPYWGRLDGWGFMASNAYLKGRFMLQNGDDVLTRFEITEGLIRSEISALRTEILDQYNYLQNASFSANTDYWQTNSDIRLFTVSARFLYFNDNFYADKRSVAAIVVEGDRRALRIKKTSVKQVNDDLAKCPKEPLETIEGEVWPTFYVSFKYKCVKRGTLKIGFPGQEFYFTEEIEPTDTFRTKEFFAPWDGTGDFVIDFTGDIFIYSLALSDDKLENYWIQTKTRFYQTESKIGLMAENINNIEQTITLLGIDIDALEERLLIYVNKLDELNSTVLDMGIELNAQSQKLSLYVNKTNTLEGTITQIGIDLSAMEKSLTLYVKDGDLTGREVISRINLTPGGALIEARNINLVGAVTFNSFDTSLQSLMNNKANISSLGDLAYQQTVMDAMEGETLIIGGYLNTQLIKVGRIDATEGYIGGFSLKNNNLLWTQLDYFGSGSRSIKLGLADDEDGAVDISFSAATPGAYGIKTVGTALGGAAVYASTTANGSKPFIYSTYAGWFHGGVHVEGSIYSNMCLSYKFGTISKYESGQYYYYGGVSFGPEYDLDNVRFTVKSRIIVALHKDNGSIIMQG